VERELLAHLTHLDRQLTHGRVEEVRQTSVQPSLSLGLSSRDPAHNASPGTERSFEQVREGGGTASVHRSVLLRG
jgi:hypothetical protein